MIKIINQFSQAICNHIDLKTMEKCAIGRVLKYKSNIPLVRYRHDLSKSELELYEGFEQKLFQQICSMIEALNISSFFVVSYYGDWMSEYCSYDDKDWNNYVLLVDSLNDILMIFKSALRYKAFPVIIDENLKISFVPTDHLDVFIAFSQIEILNKISDICSPFEIVEWR